MSGYSVHIGLNYVDPAAYDGWDGELSGCINDANSMQQLASNAGFSTSKLIDSQASSQAVIGELARLARTAVAGDLVLVTYSGHGGQVDDSNGDEPDWRDETWVLWDRQVIDDELFQMWSQFAAGVRILLISDSCHSGTVARVMICNEAREKLADASRAMTDDSPTVELARVSKNLPIDVQAGDNDRRRGTYEFVQALSGPKSGADIAAQLILISGCQDNQLSYDGAVNGQFTGTLLQVWAGGAFSGDYATFHRTILDRMPPDQSPNFFTVGTVSPGYLAQKPFTIAAPSGTAPTPTNGARPTLRVGSSGTDVVYLQQRLNAHGHSLTADGIFGYGTQHAVQQFQSAHGLTPDGVVGPATWNALETAPIGTGTGGTGGGGTTTPVGGGTSGGGGTGGGGGTTGPGTGTGGTPGTGTGGGMQTIARPTIRRGDTGEHVQHLQHRLTAHGWRLDADGIFGPGTESAVRSFQRSRSLAADGIVGAQTWAALG